ncbi:MAG: polyprenyl synthetase family protein [Pseudomonadota bacterium]
MSVNTLLTTDPEIKPEVSPIQQLASYVETDLGRVQDLMQNRTDSHVPLIPKLAGHIITAGGKYFRALLTLATAKACGYRGDRHVELAACIEFIHNATLLHDDVIDESMRRRGVPSANAIWGDKASILVGDFLFSRAFELMVGGEDGSMDVLAILSQTASLLIEGEVQQLTLMNNTEMTQEVYLEIIRAKTARLFAASCEIGGVIAKCSPKQRQALADYGMNLGIAFQLVDDILDYQSNSETLGKDIGTDFREGKMTLPVIYAYALGSNKEQQFWQRTIAECKQEEEDFSEALAYLQQHDVFAKTSKLAEEFVRKAQYALVPFGKGQPWDLFAEVVASSVKRSY